MVELSNERIEKILHEETVKKAEPEKILRSIYTRYMCLYEKYYADIDALDDEIIAGLRNYHEETKSLVKYFYMDIPLDICKGIEEFEDKYTASLLGSEWHEYLFGEYKDFKEKNNDKNKSEEYYKTEYTKQALTTFYYAMDYIFRDGFGTGSQSAKNIISVIKGLLSGKE